MLNNIQALRALAAYLIVCAHMNMIGLPFTGQMFPGVDLFFVISGFVIVHTTTGKHVTPARFLQRRIIRIVPLYWVLTLLVTACALTFPNAMQHTRPDVAQFAKSMLFVAYDKHDGMIRPLLAPGWTLNLEMLFYAAFSAALVLQRPVWRVAAASAFLAMLVAVGILLQPHDPSLIFYSSPMLLEFTLGMLLGLIHGKLKVSVPMAVAIGALGLFTMLMPGLSTEGPWRLIAPGLPATAIVFSALALEARGVRCESRNLLLLGGASYSLYLTHLFVIVPVAIGARYLDLTSGLGVSLSAAIILVTATAVALLCHLYLERPMSILLRHAAKGRRSSLFRQPQPAVDYAATS